MDVFKRRFRLEVIQSNFEEKILLSVELYNLLKLDYSCFV